MRKHAFRPTMLRLGAYCRRFYFIRSIHSACGPKSAYHIEFPLNAIHSTFITLIFSNTFAREMWMNRIMEIIYLYLPANKSLFNETWSKNKWREQTMRHIGDKTKTYTKREKERKRNEKERDIQMYTTNIERLWKLDTSKKCRLDLYLKIRAVSHVLGQNTTSMSIRYIIYTGNIGSNRGQYSVFLLMHIMYWTELYYLLVWVHE